MSRKVGIKERVKYEFENTLSKGTIAIIGWLALVFIDCYNCWNGNYSEDKFLKTRKKTRIL